MTLVPHHAWNRHQLVGDRAWSTPAHREVEAEPLAWNAAQMIGDRPGLIRRLVEVDQTSDGLPHGFSGFGISGVGGQRWASPTVVPTRRSA